MVLCGMEPRQVVLLGTRSFSSGEARFIRDQKIEMVTAADCSACPPEALAGRIARRLKGLSAVYLAVDIDGFDASCAPGTGYPMPGGPAAEVFFTILEKLFERLPIRAMDITEISPPLDTNDVTGFLGVQVVLEALGAMPA
jgi:agmatinase